MSDEQQTEETAQTDEAPKTWRRWLLDKVLLVVVGVVVVVTVLVVFFESALIYHPMRQGNWQMRPGVEMSDVEFDTEDGVRLHAWYVRAKGERVGTLLYCHGNAGNLSHRDWLVIQLSEMGMDVLIFDYRGYGKSADVAPSEEGLYRDVRAAWKHLTGPLGVPASEVVVMGQSLGGAVACQLATEADVAGLLLVCPFASIADMAWQIVPLPLGWALRHKMDNRAKVRGITKPTLIFHAERDEVVPYRQGKRVFEASAGSPKDFVTVEGAHHNNVWDAGGVAMMRRVRDFVSSCAGR